MKISFDWLKDHIEIQESINTIADLLTNSGLEVEKIENIEAVKGGLKGVVIGEVLECNQHPNADRLKLTKVDIGQAESLQIVCGANNIEKGQKIFVATEKTILYIDDKPLKINKNKIRGEESFGMICSEMELGIGNAKDGIMVLDPSAKAGQQASEYLNLQNDQILEIGLTPNRTDAMSHMGVARDLIALKTVFPDIKITSKLKTKADFSTFINEEPLKIDIEVQNQEACKRYAGITVRNIKVKPSSQKLQNKLLSIGLKPINNIVDITNFILHDLGQPLHAFDVNKIEGNKIIVKTNSEITSFTTLDEIKRELHKDDLIICNALKPMCIAGVFGGIESSVTNKTTDVFIESAYFNPVNIRKTAKRHGLNTDASYRFERGVDPEITIVALQRAVELILKEAGGEIGMNIVDIYPQKIESKVVEFNFENCHKIIGKRIDEELIKSILKKLEIIILSENKKTLTLQIPKYRVDVDREIDVIEEILRIYGYNKIEVPSRIYRSLSPSSSDSDNEFQIKDNITKCLNSLGFYEIMTNTLTSSKLYNEIEKDNEVKKIEIKNPLSREFNIMRQTLLYDAIKSTVYNQNRNIDKIKFFEFGKVFYIKKDDFIENEKLLILISGVVNNLHWMEKKQNFSFFHIKGILNVIIERLGILNFKYDWKTTQNQNYEYGLDLYINDKYCGVIGKVNQNIVNLLEGEKEIFATEIEWKILLKLSSKISTKYKPYIKFPVIQRDLSLLLDEEVKYEKIEKLSFSKSGKFLQSLRLFDVYQGKNLPKGKKSYALNFVFQCSYRTLKDEEVEKIMQNLIQNFEKQFNAQIR